MAALMPSLAERAEDDALAEFDAWLVDGARGVARFHEARERVAA